MLHGSLDGVASHLLPGVKPLDAVMHEALAPLATYISPYTILCPQDRCTMFAAPGAPMQFDYHHLTPEGAAWLMTTLRRQTPDLLGPSAINEQAVAGAAHGLQEQRVGGVHFDLSSQPVHLDVDRALIAGTARTAQRLP